MKDQERDTPGLQSPSNGSISTLPLSTMYLPGDKLVPGERNNSSCCRHNKEVSKTLLVTVHNKIEWSRQEVPPLTPSLLISLLINRILKNKNVDTGH